MHTVFSMLIIGLLAINSVTLVYAHRHDANIGLDDWFKGLRNTQGGMCCDNLGEAVKVEDPDYEVMPNGNYRIQIDGVWIEVPEGRIVKGPNKYGPALAWLYKDTNFKTAVRCFLPGSGT